MAVTGAAPLAGKLLCSETVVYYSVEKGLHILVANRRSR